MNGCTAHLIWRFPADFVDVSYLWPLSVMATVPTDAAPDSEELSEDLTFEKMQLRGDLKGLGYDVDDIPDFLKETSAGNECPDSKTTEAARVHAAIIEEKSSFKFNKCSLVRIGSFCRCTGIVRAASQTTHSTHKYLLLQELQGNKAFFS
jgi:hypothetical protein